MNSQTFIANGSALLVWLVATAGCATTEYLKEVPPAGTVPLGKMVYVDDGKCPVGEVKRIVGGSLAGNIPRQVQCVKRPG